MIEVSDLRMNTVVGASLPKDVRISLAQSRPLRTGAYGDGYSTPSHVARQDLHAFAEPAELARFHHNLAARIVHVLP